MTTTTNGKTSSAHGNHRSAGIFLLALLKADRTSYNFDSIRHEATVRTADGAYLHVFQVFDPVHPDRTPAVYVIRMLEGLWTVVS